MLPVLAVLANLSATLSVSDRTELRLRTPGADTSKTSIDVENVPEARLSLASRQTRYLLSYAPRLTLWDLNVIGVKPLVLHQAVASAEWRERTFTLTLLQDASYGGMNFAATTITRGAAGGAGGRVDVVPGGDVLRFASSTTAGNARVVWRRWAFDTTVGYQLSGGVGGDAQTSLPLQYGPAAEARLGYAASRVDQLSTALAASQLEFSSGQDIVLLQADETWRRRLTRNADAQFMLGVTSARTRAAGQRDATVLHKPMAEAALEHRFGSPREEGDGRIDSRLALRLGPVVNRLLGAVDQRIEGSLGTGWTYTRFEARAFGSVSQSIPSDSDIAVRLMMGELSLGYRASRTVRIDLGVRGLWQRQAQPVQAQPGAEGAAVAQATLFQRVGYVALTFQAPPTRF